jgi:hypothetical protein
MIRARTYAEAVRLANAVGLDAAVKRMVRDGRKQLSKADRDHGIAVSEKAMHGLGYPVREWLASQASIQR